MEPVTLLAFVLAVSLPLGQSVLCHVCELENDFGCLNPRNCTIGESNCIIVAMKIFPRFYIVSKQCVSACPTMEGVLIMTTPTPTRSLYRAGAKVYTLQEPTPFIFIHCCKEDLCNEEGPSPSMVSSYREQTGRASEERHHPLLPPTLWVLTVAAAHAHWV
ncbi:lymphocyte antigen 6K-like [Dipodomys merriami]|uniref:lymphocyte antigen 6K-like n=1 Tax=Dipodomys merriami TaxID=94247 RepID=UPI003855CF00